MFVWASSLKLSWSVDRHVVPGPTKMLIHAHVLLGKITLSPKHYIHKRPEHPHTVDWDQPHAISTQCKLWCYGCECVGFLLMPLVHPSVKHAGCTQLITFVCCFYFFLLTAVRLQNSTFSSEKQQQLSAKRGWSWNIALTRNNENSCWQNSCLFICFISLTAVKVKWCIVMKNLYFLINSY